MSNRLAPRSVGLSAAFLLGAISVVYGPSAVPAPQVGATKVGVVDMDKVLKAYPHAEARLAGLTGLIEETKKEMNSSRRRPRLAPPSSPATRRSAGSPAPCVRRG